MLLIIITQTIQEYQYDIGLRCAGSTTFSLNSDLNCHHGMTIQEAI